MESTEDSAAAAAQFHFTMRRLQAPPEEATFIAETLSEMYGTRLTVPEEESNFFSLPPDMLGAVLGLLSFTERTQAALVCKQWLRKVWASDDPRILRAGILRLDARDVVEFLSRSTTLCRIGRMKETALMQLIHTDGFPKHRIIQVRREAQGGLKELLPHVTDLTLYLESGSTVISPNMPIAKLSLFGAHSVGKWPYLKQLRVDDPWPALQLTELIDLCPCLESLDVREAGLGEGFIPQSRLKSLRIRGKKAFDSVVLTLPSLTELKARVHESQKAELPVSLLRLKLCSVQQYYPKFPHLALLKSLQLSLLDPFQTLAPFETFLCLKELSLSNVSRNLLDCPLQLPESLQRLTLKRFVVPETSFSRLSDLRVLVLENCEDFEGHVDSSLFKQLPNRLEKLMIISEKCKSNQFRLTVEDWIRLPPFLQNIPRWDSVQIGLTQFPIIE